MPRKNYQRDGRSPVPVDERVSALMSRIRSKDTGPEKVLRHLLSQAGVRGYRLNYKKAPGKPDIAFVGKMVAVFIHGCFWHGCPYCKPRRPRSNKGFWNEKLDRNAARDERKVRALRAQGWRVVTVWECRLRKFPASAVRRVERALAQPLR